MYFATQEGKQSDGTGWRGENFVCRSYTWLSGAFSASQIDTPRPIKWCHWVFTLLPLFSSVHANRMMLFIRLSMIAAWAQYWYLSVNVCRRFSPLPYKYRVDRNLVFPGRGVEGGGCWQKTSSRQWHWSGLHQGQRARLGQQGQNRMTRQ